MRPFSYENIYVRVMLYLHVPFFLQGDDLFTYLSWLWQQWMGFFLIGITLFTYHPHNLGTGFLQITYMEMTKNLQSVDMEFSTRYHFFYENFLMKIYFEKFICPGIFFNSFCNTKLLYFDFTVRFWLWSKS